MEIKLEISCDSEICLNISHHHVLQGFIYKLMEGDSEYADFIHNKGYNLNNRWFKGFVFGKLEGQYRISGKTIAFEPEVYLTIRSPFERLIMAIIKGASSNRVLSLGENRVVITSFNITKTPDFGETVLVQTLSPVTTHITMDMDGKGYTKYLTPYESEFYRNLEENALRKIRALSGADEGVDEGVNDGVEADSTPEFFPFPDMEYKKYVTKFKNSVLLTGWEGKFLIKGGSRELSLLYDTGIGSNNSQGFGLFKVIKG